MTPKGFLILADFAPALARMDRETQGELFNALLLQVLDKPLPELSPAAQVAFDLLQPSIQRAQETYSRKVEASRESGSRGGRPRKVVEPETQQNPIKPNETQLKPIKANGPIEIKIENKTHTEKEKERECVCAFSAEEEKAEEPTNSDDDFASWWAVYPKHTGKAAALDEWRKLEASGSLPSLSVLTTALSWQTAQDAWAHERYIPAPANWLAGRRWEDEPPHGAEPESPASPLRMVMPEGMDIRPTEQDFAENQKNLSQILQRLGLREAVG